MIGCGASGPAPKPASTEPIVVPVTESEDRFFLETTTGSGARLRMYLDSAGSVYLNRDSANRLALPIRHEGLYDLVDFPAFADPRIPRPETPGFPVLDRTVTDDAPELDGMLGAAWFDDRVFTFDYAAKQLHFRPGNDLPRGSELHRIPLHFQRNEAGEVVSPYGRLQAQVDGVTLDWLFDTGATVTLTATAKQALGGDVTERGTSFVTDMQYKKWRAAHPEWRVIEKAEQHGDRPMIEVPEITLAGSKIGPVWFTWQPEGFHDVMDGLMDKPAVGALGGSAFRHFKRVTADWRTGVIVFEP